MQIGASTAFWAAASMLLSSSGSSTSGIPALMSSMSAPASTCATASTDTVDRSPPRSSSAKLLRPVGLIRSPMMQNGCSRPIVTVLDRERSTVSIGFPFVSRRDAQTCAELCDACVLAERDEVKARHPGLRQRVRCLLIGDLEALGLGVGGALDPLDVLTRDVDAGHLRGHEAHAPDGAQNADRGDHREARTEARVVGVTHERFQQLGTE